jgi:hypothetical protein
MMRSKALVKIPPFGVVFAVDIIAVLGEGGLRAEEIPGETLDGGDVDEGVTGLGRGEISVGQDLGAKLIVVAKILALKALGVDFVFLGELVASGSVECVEFADGLSARALRSTRNRMRRTSFDSSWR